MEETGHRECAGSKGRQTGRKDIYFEKVWKRELFQNDLYKHGRRYRERSAEMSRDC